MRSTSHHVDHRAILWAFLHHVVVFCQRSSGHASCTFFCRLACTTFFFGCQGSSLHLACTFFLSWATFFGLSGLAAVLSCTPLTCPFLSTLLQHPVLSVITLSLTSHVPFLPPPSFVSSIRSSSLHHLVLSVITLSFTSHVPFLPRPSFVLSIYLSIYQEFVPSLAELATDSVVNVRIAMSRTLSKCPGTRIITVVPRFRFSCLFRKALLVLVPHGLVSSSCHKKGQVFWMMPCLGAAWPCLSSAK